MFLRVSLSHLWDPTPPSARVLLICPILEMHLFIPHIPQLPYLHQLHRFRSFPSSKRLVAICVATGGMEGVIAILADFSTRKLFPLRPRGIISYVTLNLFHPIVLITLRLIHTVPRLCTHMVSHQRRRTQYARLYRTKHSLLRSLCHNSRGQLLSSVTEPSSKHCPLSHHAPLIRCKSQHLLFLQLLPCRFALLQIRRSSLRPRSIRHRMR